MCLAMQSTASVSGRLCLMMHEAAAELPVEGMSFVLVPVGHEAVDAVDQGGLAGEVPAAENPTLQDREPDLDLVHPRGVLRGVHEVESTTVLGVELLPRLAVVNIEVVPDDIHVTYRVLASDGLHELRQVGRSSTGAALAVHLASSHIEGCQQRHGAVALVLELEAAQSPLRCRPARKAPAERLDARLLVDA